MRRLTLVVIMAVAAITGCGDDGSTALPTNSTTSTGPAVVSTTTTALATTLPPETTSTPVVTSATPEAARDLVNVYWAWTIPTARGTPERLGASLREVMTDDPLTEALRIVVGGGPDEIEQALGMTTAFPVGTRVLGVEIDGDTAVVDLTSEFTQAGGTLGEGMRLAQIVFTATQFDGIERVRFRVEGIDQEFVGTHGAEVGDGLTRDGSQDVRPAILVENPSPVVPVRSSFTVRGEANTFEANVLYRVTDDAGTVLAEGFTTASSGTGTWGTFAVDIDLPADVTGEVRLDVFESSAEDGSDINVVSYPLRIGSR